MLTLLCVTKAEPYASGFLAHFSAVASRVQAQYVLAADGPHAAEVVRHMPYPGRYPSILPVMSKGYLESVLDVALAGCLGPYVLRMDDDEMCSPAMIDWLADRAYREAPHWKFPRAHLASANPAQVMMHPQLWPDHQTRLSLLTMAGGRRHIHAGSPYGGGREAPVVIEHHKFLVKTVDERRAIAARYDAVQPGAGTGGMLAFNLPEELDWTAQYAPLGTGLAEAIR